MYNYHCNSVFWHFLKLSKPLWVSPPVMGLIQLSSASRIKKEVLLSLCLLFLCVVCSIITRCTHTLFGGWWGVLGTISFHLKCCVADLQKKKIITHCGFCPHPPSLSHHVNYKSTFMYLRHLFQHPHHVLPSPGHWGWLLQKERSRRIYISDHWLYLPCRFDQPPKSLQSRSKAL